MGYANAVIGTAQKPYENAQILKNNALEAKFFSGQAAVMIISSQRLERNAHQQENPYI